MHPKFSCTLSLRKARLPYYSGPFRSAGLFSVLPRSTKYTVLPFRSAATTPKTFLELFPGVSLHHPYLFSPYVIPSWTKVSWTAILVTMLSIRAFSSPVSRQCLRVAPRTVSAWAVSVGAVS